jgi:hypothetical protein
MGIPAAYGAPSKLLDWEAVDTKLRDAQQYWFATVRPDGRPHVVPLDGNWLDGRWWFGGSPETVKHQNLQANVNAALHLEDAQSAVIVEGRCRIEPGSEELADRLTAAATAKYGYAPPRAAYLSGVWVLTPTKVLAWTDLTADATRFLFD